MKHSLFDNVPQPIFEAVENENFEAIGQTSSPRAVWSNITVSCDRIAVSARLYFYNSGATGIEVSDFQIGNYSGSRWYPQPANNWTITVSSSSVSAGSYVTVTATPRIANITHDYVLRLIPLRVRVNRSSTDNFPPFSPGGIFSSRFRIDDTPYFTTSRTTLNNRSSINTAVATLKSRYHYSVSGLSGSDFSQALSTIYGTNNVNNGKSLTITPASSTITAGGTVNITITAPDDVKGYFTIWLNNATLTLNSSPTAIVPSSQVYLQGIYFDTQAYFSSETGGATGTARLYFRYSGNISGISSSDFYVTRFNARIALTGWSISVSSSSATNHGFVTVTITPPDNTDSSYYLALRPNSLRIGASTSNNAPVQVLRSGQLDISNSPYFTFRSNTSRNPAIYARLHNRYSRSLSGVAGGTSARSGQTYISDFSIGTSITNNYIEDRFFLSGWDIQVSSTTIAAGGSINVTVYPPIDTFVSTAYITLRANTLTLNSSPTQSSPPLATVVSSAIRIDSRAYWSHMSGGTGFSGRINFPWPNSVSGISASDFQVVDRSYRVVSWPISVSSSTASAINGYVTVTASVPGGVSGQYRLRLKSRTVTTGSQSGPIGDKDSALTTVRKSRTAPTRATASWSNVVGGRTLSGRLNITGNSITGLSSSDFEIRDSNNVVQRSGWSISFFGSTVSNGSYITITATPPNNITGSYKIRLKSNSVRSGSSTSNDAPRFNTDTGLVSINTLPVVATVSWENEAGGTTFTARLRFTYSAIEGIDTSDIEVLNSADTHSKQLECFFRYNYSSWLCLYGCNRNSAS